MALAAQGEEYRRSSKIYPHKKLKGDERWGRGGGEVHTKGGWTGGGISFI